MPARVTLGNQAAPSWKGSLLAVAVAEKPALGETLAELDTVLGGSIGRALESRDFRGGKDEVFQLSGTSDAARRVLLVGMGKVSDRSGSLRRAAAVAARQAMKLGTGDIAFHAETLGEREVEAITVGLIAGSWEYKDLKTAPPEDERRRPLESAVILTAESDGAKKGLQSGEAIGAGHSLARTLAMMPGNLCTPEFLAKTGEDIAARHG